MRYACTCHLRTMRTRAPPAREQFALAAEVLALLGDRTRLTLLHALTAGEALTSPP